MRIKILPLITFLYMCSGSVSFVSGQPKAFVPPAGAVFMPGRSGLYPTESNGNFVYDAHKIYRLIDGEDQYTPGFQEVFSSKKEIKNAYLEKRFISGLFSTNFCIIVQYMDGQYARVCLDFILDFGFPDMQITDLPNHPGPELPSHISGDDLYCFINNSVYVLRDQVNGPWLIDTAGLPEVSGRSLQDMNIDSFQNVWLICNNRLYMQPLVSSTWTRKSNLSGNKRLFIDRFQKIWLGRDGNVVSTIDQGTTMVAGPAGIGAGEGTIGLSTDYNGDVYIMTYTFYPVSGGGNKIYRSAGGTANFVRIDQNLATQFAQYGSNQIYNGIYVDSGVYVAHGSGQHFSKDAGATWEYIPGPPSPSAYAVVPTADNQLMMTTPAGAYKGNDGNWAKKHPAGGFQNNINLYRAGNGDIYAQSEEITNSSGGDPRWVIYKSTDNGNSFVADSAGLGAANVGMDAFYADETGTQHAAGNVFVPGLGSKITIWKKPPGQPWVLDMNGFPEIYYQSVRQFTSDGQGNIHCHFRNAASYPVSYTRQVNGNTWTDVVPLGLKTITDQTGRADGVTVFAVVRNGSSTTGELIKKTANSYANIPLPNGIIAENITVARVAFDSSGALWAHFSMYPFFPPPSPPNAQELGAGLFYTTDFINWKKPTNDVDTAIFRSIKAIGDSVFAIPQNFDGVHVFKKLAAGTIYTFTGNGNWTEPANWLNSLMPPAVLPTGAEIIIQPAGNGECILNTNQTVAPGGKFTVSDAKKLKVTGALNIIKN